MPCVLQWDTLWPTIRTREYVVAIPHDVTIDQMNMQQSTGISITDISRPRDSPRALDAGRQHNYLRTTADLP